MKKFWMVLNESTGYTKFRHETPEAARIEAERLARTCPTTKFFVLGVEGFAVKRDVDWHKPDPDTQEFSDEITF